MGDVDEPKALTVSREALRADLAEMELRLRIYFDEQLKHKADQAVVAEHSLQLDRLSRGEWTPAQKLAIEEIVDGSMSERSDRGWTTKERLFGVAAILISVLTLIVTVAVATNHWQ